ncbi:hypothetical protein C8R46DRAFT_288567 [Mycena filopes]|nr:hypothetical protein C8R46DRAFT_288567 [Mycena filopes]
MRILWCFLTVFTVGVNADPTNHTVDDTSPQLSGNQQCQYCGSAAQLGFDTGRLNNGTVTTVESTVLQFNFTGTAIYIFIAIPAIGTMYFPFGATGVGYVMDNYPPDGKDTGTLGVITLDGEGVTNTAPTFPILNVSQYSYCAWSTTNLADGPHSLELQIGGLPIMLDSIVYTSNVTNPGASSKPTPTDVPNSGVSASSISATSLGPHNKAPVAIAGGVIGGTVLILGFLVGWVLLRRAKHAKEPTSPVMEESVIPAQHNLLITQFSPDGGVITATNTGALSRDAVSAERFRLLEEEVRQLRQQRAGSSTVRTSLADSDATAPGRSLSTLKREQTRAVMEHERGEGVTDRLVHTDSGLSLTAGPTVNELPPTYVAD